jgi:hypothetical protein
MIALFLVFIDTDLEKKDFWVVINIKNAKCQSSKLK